MLAIATFSATRSANRASRASEQALKIGLRPVLFNARPQDPPQKVGYSDDHSLLLRDGLAAAQESEGNIYLAIPLRNVASGLAVLHAWHLWPERIVRRSAAAAARAVPQTHARPLRAGGGHQLLAGSAARSQRPPLRACAAGAQRRDRPLSRDPLRRPRGRTAHDHALQSDAPLEPSRRRAVALGMRDDEALEPRSRRSPLSRIAVAVPLTGSRRPQRPVRAARSDRRPGYRMNRDATACF